jgi:hypothetical protein
MSDTGSSGRRISLRISAVAGGGDSDSGSGVGVGSSRTRQTADLLLAPPGSPPPKSPRMDAPAPAPAPVPAPAPMPAPVPAPEVSFCCKRVFFCCGAPARACAPARLFQLYARSPFSFTLASRAQAAPPDALVVAAPHVRWQALRKQVEALAKAGDNAGIRRVVLGAPGFFDEFVSKVSVRCLLLPLFAAATAPDVDGPMPRTIGEALL